MVRRSAIARTRTPVSMRLQRVEALLQREVASMLAQGELRDPRLADPAGISITGVKVSADLSSARVFFDVLVSDRDKEQVAQALNAAASAVRGRLGPRLRLKRTPSLRFEYDDSVARGQAIEDILSELSEG